MLPKLLTYLILALVAGSGAAVARRHRSPATEVCVKAAVGHPDTLGDCEYSALPLHYPTLILPRRVDSTAHRALTVSRGAI